MTLYSICSHDCLAYLWRHTWLRFNSQTAHRLRWKNCGKQQSAQEQIQTDNCKNAQYTINSGAWYGKVSKLEVVDNAIENNFFWGSDSHRFYDWGLRFQVYQVPQIFVHFRRLYWEGQRQHLKHTSPTSLPIAVLELDGNYDPCSQLILPALRLQLSQYRLYIRNLRQECIHALMSCPSLVCLIPGLPSGP